MADSDDDFLADAKARVLDHLRARRDAGKHDTVVAVVEAPDGTLHEGSTFLSSQPQFDFCAERHALHEMEHETPAFESFERLFVAGAVPSPDDEVTTPCGACRHALHEFNPDATVFCSTVVREETGWTAFPSVESFTVADLYPHPFEPPTWD